METSCDSYGREDPKLDKEQLKTLRWNSKYQLLQHQSDPSGHI